MRIEMIAAGLALAVAPAGAQQTTALAPGETLLEVQVTGEARMAADMALVTIGVVSTGTTAREATDTNARQMTAGYIARNSVAVRITRLGTAPDVIAAAFAAGANSVNGPTLGNDDPQAGLREAREQALENARTQADAYATGLGCGWRALSGSASEVAMCVRPAKSS